MGSFDGAGDLFSVYSEIHFSRNSLILQQEAEDPVTANGISRMAGRLSARYSEESEANENDEKPPEDVVGHTYMTGARKKGYKESR